MKSLAIFLATLFFIYFGGFAQMPITPNPLLQLDQTIINGVEIGESIFIQVRRLNQQRIVTYVAYVPGYTTGLDYFEFDLLTGGTYGKLSIKDNDLKNIYAWNTNEIFNTYGYRVLNCWSLDIDNDTIVALVGAEEQVDVSLPHSHFMGILKFDTTLQLISSKWFSDPFETHFRYPINVFRLPDRTYLKYGRSVPGQFLLAQFDSIGNALKTETIISPHQTSAGGQTLIMPNGELILNPGFIVDSDFKILARYNQSHNTLTRRLFTSINSLNDTTFLYGYTDRTQVGNQYFAEQKLIACDLHGNEKIIHSTVKDITSLNPPYRISAGKKCIESSDTNQITFAFYNLTTGQNPKSEIVIKSVKMDGTVNWEKSFGGDHQYVPLEIVKIPSGGFHLIVYKYYDVAWVDPTGFPYPKTDLMYVTFDMLGNVVSLSSDSEPQNKSKILVYPNPAKHHVNFEDFGQFSQLVIEIFDSAGRRVLAQKTSEKRVSMHGFAGGLYLYRVFDEEMRPVQSGKIMVEE